MSKVSIAEAQQRLPDLIAEAARGQAVLIVGGDGAEYQLAPVHPAQRRPVFGSARGMIEMTADFDDPIEGFEPYS